MALIIGADNVIKLTGGKEPKIVFETDDWSEWKGDRLVKKYGGFFINIFGLLS